MAIFHLSILNTGSGHFPTSDKRVEQKPSGIPVFLLQVGRKSTQTEENIKGTMVGIHSHGQYDHCEREWLVQYKNNAAEQ
jgi:hypothetical protein